MNDEPTAPQPAVLDGPAWLEANQRFLAACWAWLSLVLERRAGAPPAEAPRRRCFLRRASGVEPGGTGSTRRIDREVAAAREAVEAARQAMPTPPPLDILADCFGLSSFETNILLLCAGIDLHPPLLALCAAAKRDPAQPHPTFALALDVFAEPSWEALAAESPLRFWKLIEIGQPAAQPLTAAALRADEWTLNVINGLEKLDDRIATLLEPLPDGPTKASLPPSQQATVDTLTRLVGERAHVVAQLVGAHSTTKRMLAASVTGALGRPLRRISAEALPTSTAELDHLLRLLAREHRLWRLVYYLDAFEVGEGPRETAAAIRRFLDRLDAPVFFDARDAWPALGQSSVTLDVRRPTSREQRHAWQSLLGAAAGEAPGMLAAQFDLELPAIHAVATAASAAGGGDPQATLAAAWDGSVELTRPRLDGFAQQIVPNASWDQLVLPADELAQLREMVNHVRHRSRVYQDWGFADGMSRGLGITALFQGESGTGKTMTAEVIARELRLPLFRVDLSAVVSKFIGETEKNLRRVFDAAEDGGAILFFDEADALFGKRSEVKDSHDRYANIEINYLLQRMEAFRGLAILATNVKNALDPAFQRRVRFTIDFPFPSLAERRAIWRRVFPPAAPIEGLDYDRLARLPLTGGNILAVALNAAFLAARTPDKTITMAETLEAAARELERLNRPVNGADLRVPRKAVSG